jgi:hypothetical protein
MRKTTHSLSLAVFALASFHPIDAHTQAQLNHHPLEANQLGLNDPPVNLEKPSALAAIPAEMTTRFDPNVFQQEEQTHDKLLDNLATRVGDLESTSSWVKGAIAGILVFGGFIIGFFSKLWKWILSGALNELNPQILQTSSVSPLPVAAATPPSKR